MNKTAINIRMLTVVALLSGMSVLASCATSPPPCNGPQSKNLNAAISDVKQTLSGGCAAHFDRYYDDLLTVAEGDPKPKTKGYSANSWYGQATKGC